MNKSNSLNLLVFRGDWFDINFSEFTFDDSYQQIREFLSQKNLQVTHTDETYRVINSWSQAGLLVEDAERDAGWRKFSLADICWISILSELRKLGLSLEKLATLKNSILNSQKKHLLPTYHFYLAASLVRSDVLLIVAPSGEGALALEPEYRMSKVLEVVPSTIITINISRITASILKRPAIVNDKKVALDLGDKELSVLAQISSDKNLKNVSLDIKDRKISRINFTTKSNNPTNAMKEVETAMKKHAFSEIIVKVENGRPVCMEVCEKR